MALAYRVNINFCPLFNTFHCKCMMNITRFKSRSNLQTKSQTSSGNEESNYKTFEKLITYRQTQACKSIIVRIKTFEAVGQVEKFCSYYGRILNIFPYTTFSNQRFVLIEFADKDPVLDLRRCASGYTANNDAIRSVSPMFMYEHKKIHNQAEIANSNPIASIAQFSIPMMTEIVDKLKPLKSVSDQMINLHDILKVAELDIRLRFYTAEEITYYLSRLFANLNVIPFGSSVNGFGQTGCDLDLLCRTCNNHNPADKQKRFTYLSQLVYYNDRAKQQHFLEIVHQLMMTCIPGVSNMRKILEARVPILKFTNLNTNMQCDLSSTNVVALSMSELLYTCGTLDERVKPLVCTIRKWAQVNYVTRNNPGTWITNFSLTLLIIFYLQRRGILPSIAQLKSGKKVQNDSETVSSRKRANNKDNLEQLLFGFFEYYSTFNFKMQAICIRDAQLKEKRDNSPIFIFNPFDSSLNVSKNINLIEQKRITEQFQNALYVLIQNSQENGILQLFTQRTNKGLTVNIGQPSIINAPEVQEKSKLCDQKLSEETTSEDAVKAEGVIK